MKKLIAPSKLKGHLSSKESLSYQLKKYALLTTGIFTLGVKQTKAAIIFTDLDPDLVTTGATSGNPAFQVDLDGGGNDIGIGFYSYYYYYNGNSSTTIYGQMRTFRSDFRFTAPNVFSYQMLPQSAGTVIGPGSTFGNQQGNSSPTWTGDETDGFLFDTEQIVGITFELAGNTHYGWAKVQLTSTSFTLLEYAYEDVPDVTIEAGELPTLAVELASFEIKNVDNRAHLSWTTNTELDNYGFAIERSKDDLKWESIGFVAGHGTTQNRKEYAFNDDDLLSGNVYYRLRQIDEDGTFDYSPVRNIQFETALDKQALNIYPNPTVGQAAQVSFNLAKNADFEILLFDTKGKLLQRRTEQGSIGENLIPLDLNGLQAGLYFVRLQVEQREVTVKRLLIQ